MSQKIHYRLDFMGLTFTTKLFFSFKKALQVVQNGTRLPAKPPLPAKPASRQNPPPAKPTSCRNPLLQQNLSSKTPPAKPTSGKTHLRQNPPLAKPKPPAEPTSRKTQTSGKTHLQQNPPPASGETRGVGLTRNRIPVRNRLRSAFSHVLVFLLCTFQNKCVKKNYDENTTRIM